MKKTFFTIAVSLLVSSQISIAQTPLGYQLVWADEFNSALDGDKAVLPDDKWSFETGGHGWGNNELQFYVDRTRGTDTVSSIKDGTLTITAHRITEPYNGKYYLSARMNTKQAWKYGYFEARAKVASGRGTWSAFWMMPQKFQNWPLDGEIDIMEYVGYDLNRVHSTIHTQAYNHINKTEKGKNKVIVNAETEFHVYAVEWTEDRIIGYVDNEEYFRFDNDKTNNKDTWPFNEPFYLKLNLAIGGNWGGQQGVDKEIFPAKYEVDYVRVYQKETSNIETNTGGDISVNFSKVSNSLHINHIDSKISDLCITDLFGRIYDCKSAFNNGMCIVDCSNLKKENGMYILSFKHMNVIKTYKFLNL